MLQFKWKQKAAWAAGAGIAYALAGPVGAKAAQTGSPTRTFAAASPRVSVGGPEEFRNILLLAVKMSGSPTDPSGAGTGGGDLAQRVAQLTPEQLQKVYDAFSSEGRQQFAGAVVSLARSGQMRLRSRSPKPGGSVLLGIPGVLNPPDPVFPPAFPSGSSYDIFTATLPGLGDLVDTNGDGKLNDEFCDTNKEADLHIAIAAARVANVALDVVCETIVEILGEGTNLPGCIAAGIGHGIEVGLEINLDQCNFQDGLVTSAYAQSASKNTETILKALTCKPVAAIRKGQGCNGSDDNCDGQQDECAEDKFGPDLHIDGAVTTRWYKTIAEAQAAVANSAQAVDDCSSAVVDPPVLAGSCANVTATVSSKDSCNNVSTASTTVKVNGASPTVVISPGVANGCYTSIQAAEAAVSSNTTVGDACSPPSSINKVVTSTVDACSLRVGLTATNEAGSSTSSSVTLRVDTAQPTVNIERLLLGFQGAPLDFQKPRCYKTRAAAEAAVLAASRFADNCTPTEALLKSVSSAGDLCALQVTSKAVDQCGIPNTDTVAVRVDPDPPVVTSSVTTATLWSPNHDLIDVGFKYTATDGCSGAPKVDVLITSDEKTADANGAGQATFAPDAEVLRDVNGAIKGVLIRAERSTSGDGRVYVITTRATDECGNVGTASSKVTVPPNGNGSVAVDSGQFYDATQVN